MEQNLTWRPECAGLDHTAATAKKEENIVSTYFAVFYVVTIKICFLASAIQQEETCIERDSRERIPSKLQSAIYYALDGDQVNILTMLSQRGEDPWVRFKLCDLFRLHFNFSCRTAFFDRGNPYSTQPVKEVLGAVPSFSLQRDLMRYTS